jgi:para-nitrobenzyl esterase
VVAGQEVSTPWLAAVVDGTVIREAPSRTLERGGQARVPLIIGANSREYEVGAIAADPAAFLRRTGGVNADQMLAYYGLPGDGSVVDDPMLGTTTMQVSSDLIFRCPAVTVATAQARIGAPVWQYHFAYSAPGQPPVAHNSELRYVFNAPGEQGIPADAAPLQAYWINFARSGDPNGPGLALWPRYDIHRRAYLAFLPEGPRVEARLRDEICQFVPLP